MKLQIYTIPIFINNPSTFPLPEFSEILDISPDKYRNNLEILYKVDDQHVNSFNTKIMSIYMTNSDSLIPPSDSFKFFKIFETSFSEVDLSHANSGKIIPVENINKYYVFIEDVKTIAENRDEKLNKII